MRSPTGNARGLSGGDRCGDPNDAGELGSGLGDVGELDRGDLELNFPVVPEPRLLVDVEKDPIMVEITPGELSDTPSTSACKVWVTVPLLCQSCGARDEGRMMVKANLANQSTILPGTHLCKPSSRSMPWLLPPLSSVFLSKITSSSQPLEVPMFSLATLLKMTRMALQRVPLPGGTRISSSPCIN
jgi:hypothetical protein